MKKKLFTAILSSFLILLLSGCGCTHEWSEWNVNGQQMERICRLCQETEKSQIDHEVLAQQYIVGSWEGVFITDGENYPDLNPGDTAVQFNEDGTYVLEAFGETTSGTWLSTLNPKDIVQSDYIYLLDYQATSSGTASVSRVFYSAEDVAPAGLKGLLWQLSDDTTTIFVYFTN